MNAVSVGHENFPNFPCSSTRASLNIIQRQSGFDPIVATPYAGHTGNSNSTTEFTSDISIILPSYQIDSLTIYGTTIKSPDAKGLISAVIGIYIMCTNGQSRLWRMVATQPPDCYFYSMKMNPGERIDKVSFYTAKLPVGQTPVWRDSDTVPAKAGR